MKRVLASIFAAAVVFVGAAGVASAEDFEPVYPCDTISPFAYNKKGEPIKNPKWVKCVKDNPIVYPPLPPVV